MAGNVRGAMRPQGRSPPFLLIGLCVALCILGFNYWSLSYRNRELGAQIVDLQDQVRRSMSKRMTAERRGATVVDELKKCETALDMEKNEVARKESEIISLSDQLRNKVTEMTDCESKIKDVDEIRTNLKTCEENNIGINQELQKKKDELKAALQQAPARDAERYKLCKNQWVEEKKSFLNNIEKVLGPNALIQLHEAGVDIGVYAQEMDVQRKHNFESQNLLVNGQVLPQGPVNSVNAANVPVNQAAQEQPQIPQHPLIRPQQPAEGQPQVIMAQGAPDNNVPQGQAAPVNPPNPPLVNPAGGNLAETNALGANVDPAAAKANSAQSQNAIVNNPPPGNPEVAHLGGDFVPVDNPGLENAGQAAGHQANPVAAGKGAEPAAGNVGEQPIDSALNRVERPPSDMNKTTAGNSLMSNLPLPKEVLSASNISFSSRTSTQSVQTDIQTALHASQFNNTANNQTLDPKLGPSLPIANLAETNGQLNVKLNAGPIPDDDNSGKLLKDGAAKVPVGGVQDKQAGVVQDEDSIDKMQHNMNMEDDRMNRLKSDR